MKTFVIFDVNRPLMEDHAIIEAKSGALAIKQYCKSRYPNRIAKCSGSNYVQLSVREGRMDGDRLMLRGRGRQTWYELIEK